MRATLREMRRARLRIATSIIAIALAIGAMGVFAVPGVAESSLRDIAEQDQLAHIHIPTSPFDESAVQDLAQIAGVETVEGRTTGTVELSDGTRVQVVGSPSDATVDTLRLQSGRLPTELDEVLVPPNLADVGDTLTFDAVAGSEKDRTVEVVGTGQTTYWAESDAIVFALPATAQQLIGLDGFNEVVARLDDPTSDNLDATVESIRVRLDENGTRFTSFPVVLVDGAHPIEEDLVQISFMIGSLGVVAGIVALILLASTTNAIVTERTRDAAIMRALGGSRRIVRRDLRRIAITIGVLGTVIGIPFGIGIANYIATMVLERFAGISPAFGIDPIVIVASAVFGVAGARVVSGRVARRVTNTDLATALRDRDATPFGTRWTDRLLTRVPTGGITQRIALRAMARRRGRAFAVAAQFAGAVAAGVLVASLATSIADFNTAELASYKWDATTSPNDPVYPYPLDAPLGPGAEVAIHTWGEIDGWEIEIFGIDPDTEMVDTAVSSGSWLPQVNEPGQAGVPNGTAAPLVLAERFGTQEGHAIGDTVTVDLASGPASYEIIGYHPVRSVAAFVDGRALAADLGTDGAGNTLWTAGDTDIPELSGVVATTTTRETLFAEDAAARDAILAIFAAIGVIVVTIAGLGAASTVAMNLYERRSEIATLQATGARRRDIRRLIGLELGTLAFVGWLVGVAAGAAGASAIMGFFASANGVELGFTLSWLAIPVSAAGAAGLVWLLAYGAARQAQRRPLASTLRAAT